MTLFSFQKGWEAAFPTWIGPRRYCLIGERSDASRTAWTAIVMSHRNRHPEASGDWRFAVERSLQDCRSSHSFLLTSNDTPLGPFLIQAAKRLHVPVVELQLPLPRESLADWEQRMHLAKSIVPSDPGAVQLWLSPIEEPSEMETALEDRERVQDKAHAFERYPLVDRALMALADKVRVISVENGSKTEWLIHRRLDDDRFPAASVLVAMHSHSDMKSKPSTNRTHRTSNLHEDLLDRGAVGWIHSECIERSNETVCVSSQRQEQTDSSRKSSFIPLTFVPSFHLKTQMPLWSEQWPYLSHCTRARVGAWPDQSLTGYYDSLIAAKRDVDFHATAFDALKRILIQKRMVASSGLNRSGQSTVSLTEVPLPTLLPRRQFQSHLGRWDWESYGICIDRRWVERHGGRPVLYSSKVRWSELEMQDRPFFQPTRDAESPDRTDWESEREWRVVGDIHLADIPFESAVVFVPSKLEAAQLASISRFPIMVV